MPEINEQPTPKPRDFRQEVTDNIVAMLEKGVAPWQKPWDSQSHLAMPVNPTTDRTYRGGNAIQLLAVGLQRNFEDPRWMTYRQASEQGWQVRRGEKGTQIEFWDVKPQQEGSKDQPGNSETTRKGDQTKDEEPGSRLVHRVYTVFNARQIEGVPALAPKERKPFEVVEAGERILKNSGASITHDQADRAFYNRGRDEIHLPPQQAFKDAAGYYGTALHELGHWTGHPSRLNRWTLGENYKFGDTNYAKEELRAELASVFIAAEKGIPHEPENHAAYVGSWIQALKQDKNEIFRAAHDASKATDLLLSLERDVSIADQDLEANSAVLANASSDITDLQRDREVLQEQVTASHEPQNGAASQENETERTTKAQEQIGGNGEHDSRADATSNVASDQFKEASSLAAKLLGNSAKTKPAQLDAGVYRGPIIGETSGVILQRLSPRSVVVHDKDMFETAPKIGANIAVHYSEGKPAVREIKERGRALGMSR